MKKVISLGLLCFVLFQFETVCAQEYQDEIPANYKKRHALYDFFEKELTNVDTIPDYLSKQNKLKITGTVFLSDGQTPAKDVVLFINQADEDGNYVIKTNHRKRYVYHRAWTKTNADGKYTFYTFVPGSDRYSNAAKSIHLFIKEAHRPERIGDDFVFDDDPLLSSSCRELIEINGLGSILKPKPENGILVANRNIVLENDEMVAK